MAVNRNLKLQFKLPLAENVILRASSQERHQSSREDSQQPPNTSMLTTGGKTRTAEDQFGVSFTNFAFAQELNSSRNSLDDKSALSYMVELPVSQGEVILKED